MTINETITENDLPNSISGLYEHVHMINAQKTIFIDRGDQTEIISEVHYTKFMGDIAKRIDDKMTAMFTEQSKLRLEKFKLFAEKSA